jgi:predicted nucleic acid-binding protein
VSWLLDTCVISELVKPRPMAAVVAWIEACDEETLYLSVITIGELEKGIARLPLSARRAKLQGWVRHDLAERFRGRLLAIDQPVAVRWGALAGESEARGQPVAVIDGLIAATGLEHDLTVVTRNIDDFKRCGARCLNPWDEA